VEERPHAIPLDERTERMFEAWLNPKDVVFESKEAKEAYQRRTARIRDAIQLRVPDQVPIWFLNSGFFPCRYNGVTFEKAMYDSETWFSINKKMILDYNPDVFLSPGLIFHACGQAYESLGTKKMKWPGHGVNQNASFQYVEGEYMKAEEYDAFLSDMADYTIRTFLPRVFEALEPFEMLPPLKSLGITLPAISAIFTLQPLQSAFQALYQAGLESMKWNIATEAFMEGMKKLGFPALIGSGMIVPFDVISDLFRGMRGSMLDMFRYPDKLLQATEKLLPMIIDLVIPAAKRSGCPGVFIALHRGADGFMSKQQFETFYWPGLKKLLLALIEEGLTPCPFFEGDYTSRLEYLAELPRGKILGIFDNIDIHRVKEVLGNTMCISGLMPLSLLQVGTPEKVKDYTRLLIDVVGKGGGFIMAPRSAMDEADPVLVRVWTEFTKEYGIYHR